MGNSLESAKIVKASDKKSTDFTYDGTGFEADTDWVLMLGDTQLTMNAGGGLSNYQIYQDGQPVADNNPVDAGDYTIRIYGADKYAGQEAEIPFTISPIDLSSAELTFNNGAEPYATSGNAMPDYVSNISGWGTWFNPVTTGATEGVSEGWTNTDGTTLTSVNDEDNHIILTLSYQKDQSTSGAPSTSKGSYVYKLTAKNADGTECTNIIGEKTVTFTRYDETASIVYDGTVVTGDKYDDADAVSTNHFNEDYISVREDNAGAKKLDYTVSYFKKTASGYVQVEQSVTQWPGEYYAQIAVSDDTYAWGGVAEVNFNVAAVEVKDADAYVTYKGEAFDGGDVVDVYSGEDMISNLAISAYDQDGEKLPTDAFDLEVKDEDGNVVTELVDAGDYTATIKEKEESVYRLADDVDPEVEFTISPVTIKGDFSKLETDGSDNSVARFAGTLGFGANADQTYAWTGSAVIPTFEYDVEVLDYSDAEDWKALPTESYKVEFEEKDTGKKVDECVEPGWYTMHVKDAAKDGNYDVDFTVNFQISNDRVFLDVTNDKWYSEYVYTAAENEWMTGFDGTNMFGPDQDIKRGDVAVVLWKMAGKPDMPSDENWYTEEAGWNTGFGDVDGKMYYAQAIAWAKASGLVTGDTGTGAFRPEDTISRQELAAMLARYADACGEDTDVDVDAVLGGYDDAASVADWARGDVAYLASTGVMGSDSPLRGSDPITRAEVATMVVRLDGVFDFDLMPITPSNPNER